MGGRTFLNGCNFFSRRAFPPCSIVLRSRNLFRLRGLSLFQPLPLPHCPAAVYQIFAEEYRLRRQYQADQHDDPV